MGPSRPARGLHYRIEGPFTVYFAGDTGYFDGLADLADGLDIALLPIGGWGPTLPEGHLSPQTAAAALQVLRPRMAFPIHWGTFLPLGTKRLYSHYLSDPPRDFLRYAQQYAPDTRTAIVRPGESITLPEWLEETPQAHASLGDGAIRPAVDVSPGY